MKRRDFITQFCSAAACASGAAAQTPPRVPRVGCIFGTSPATGGNNLESFRQGLRELGWVEGQTVELEIRFAEGRFDRAAELVAELARLKVDVLVAGSSVASLLAKSVTQTIPIIIFAPDPVGLGLVASLARPGGNVTGLSYSNEAISAKRLEFLKELVPGLARVAVLKNPSTTIAPLFWQATDTAARTLQVALQPLDVHGPEDFEVAFSAARRGNAQALLVFDDPLTLGFRTRIISLAASSQLAAIYGPREFADEGGLMSYGPNLVALFRRAASYADKILKGAKPAELPVEQPTTFELVINLTTARALGLTVPPLLVSRADEVIE